MGDEKDMPCAVIGLYCVDYRLKILCLEIAEHPAVRPEPERKHRIIRNCRNSRESGRLPRDQLRRVVKIRLPRPLAADIVVAHDRQERQIGRIGGAKH